MKKFYRFINERIFLPIKKLSNYRYHSLTDTWVKPINRFDNNILLVLKYGEEDLLNQYSLNENELFSPYEYLKKIITGEIHGSNQKEVLKYIMHNEGKIINYNKMSDALEINPNTLIEIVRSLEKMGFIENKSSDENFDSVYDHIQNAKYFLTQKGNNVFFKNKFNVKPQYALILLFFLLFPISNVENKTTNSMYSFKTTTFRDMVEERKNHIKNEEFSFELFIEYLNLNGVKNRPIVVSQSILETANFSSLIFQENNNLFGMKEPSIRPTKAIGTNRGHAIYKHWTCSVEDYVLWYQFMTRNREYANYLEFLSNMGYAEDPDYLLKLQIIKRDFI